MEKPSLEAPADRLNRLTEEMDLLTKRLNQVSGQLQILRVLFVAILLGLAGGGHALVRAGLLNFGGEERVSETVKSKEYGLVNRDGNRLLLVDNDKFGLPNAIFMDLKKNYRMGIKVWPEGGGTPGMVFYDQSGTRGQFRMVEDGSSVLSLMGEGGKGGISLSVAPDSTPSLKLTDKTGKVLFEAPAQEK